MNLPKDSSPSRPAQAPALEVALAFLKLGLSSFGGPIAHLGYFRSEFVERRRWLSDADYADLVALCQFLPGPASSQVGMALGMMRAGWLGSLLAWLAFTLPSAILLTLLALGLGTGNPSAGLLPGLFHGLKIVAVAVVAQAVWGMAKSLCPDRARTGMATLAAAALLLFSGAWTQLLVIAAGAILGWYWLPADAVPASAAGQALRAPISRRCGAWLLALFFALLLLLPLAAHLWPSPALQAVQAFYQAGALVFGGGHVVLPLLQSAVQAPGWVSADQFLTGYAAAQAVPGPLFTLAAYLGALLPLGHGLNGVGGALLALLAIFAPAALLVLGALPFWEQLRGHMGMRRALAGINASVVGVLGAALYDPVWTSAIHGHLDLALALICYGMLSWLRLAPLAVVLFGALAGAALG
jgi:chromate transporter